ncbi:hypothetical protein ACDA63_15125 [Uliginosibacterium sp. sgz301328]|uniref:hypothetical protein n=1 Tax=Uliginosibacterium sp. sgz301328 TaxID=3243764 RepID=UPI00359E9E3C
MNGLKTVGFAAPDALLDRQKCSLISIPVAGVPRKNIEAAIKLRLQQLGVVAQPGFAWRAGDDVATVWYWDDADLPAPITASRALPWPEPLWREPLAAGARFVACRRGVELEGRGHGGLYRSRWFAASPDEQDRLAFLRDLGVDAEAGLGIDRPVTLPESRRPQSGWCMCSGAAPRVAMTTWLTCLLVLVAGCVAIGQGVEILRANQRIARLAAEKKDLLEQGRATRQIDSSLRALQPTVSAARTLANYTRQLEWLSALAEQRILGQDVGAVLTDWACRDGRAILTVRVSGNAKSGDVLTRLEESGLFSDVMLLPDPPAGTLRIQATLAELSPSAEPAASTKDAKPRSGEVSNAKG